MNLREKRLKVIYPPIFSKFGITIRNQVGVIEKKIDLKQKLSQLKGMFDEGLISKEVWDRKVADL